MTMAAIPATASARTRHPVIGCVYGGTNDFRARYQPEHCTTVTNQNHFTVIRARSELTEP
jgi:hypothetical protein